MTTKRSKRSKCRECGKPLPALRIERRAVTCSAICGQARQRRMARRLLHVQRRQSNQVSSQAEAMPNPPILGLTFAEAARRVGVSLEWVRQVCAEHGLGRICNGGRWWLTLTELRTLTLRLRKSQEGSHDIR
jgi:hypothetical protein